jgi:hypothetical protein
MMLVIIRTPTLPDDSIFFDKNNVERFVANNDDHKN